jgi:CO/xanthine dehydrogenase Mo-binding subunit
MDFLLPTAMEIPSIEIGHLETPSPLNPLGIKGVGEAGAIPGPALLAEAIDDALAPFGIRIREMPLSPGRLRELIKIGGSEPPLSPMSPTGSNAGLRGRSPRGSAA